MKTLTLMLLLAGLAAAQTQTFYNFGNGGNTGNGACINTCVTATFHDGDGAGTTWYLSWFRDAYHDSLSLKVYTPTTETVYACSGASNLAGLPTASNQWATTTANCSGTVNGQPFTLTFGTGIGQGNDMAGITFDSIYEPLGRYHQWAHLPVSGGVVITQ